MNNLIKIFYYHNFLNYKLNKMEDIYNYANELNINHILSSEGLQSRDIPKIRVIVRKRPPNKKEITKNDIDIIETRGSQTCVVKELK